MDIYLKFIKSLHRASICVPEFVKRQCNRGLIQHDGKLHISIFNVFQTFSRPKSGDVSVFTFPMRRQGIGECWITDCKNVEKTYQTHNTDQTRTKDFTSYYGGILLPRRCMMNYVNMQHNYV